MKNCERCKREERMEELTCRLRKGLRRRFEKRKLASRRLRKGQRFEEKRTPEVRPKDNQEDEVLPLRFVCYICGKRFSSQLGIIEHINYLHRKIKRRAEQKIAERASEVPPKDNQEDEVPTNDNKDLEKKFVCDPCGKDFQFHAVLKWHNKTFHKKIAECASEVPPEGVFAACCGRYCRWSGCCCMVEEPKCKSRALHMEMRRRVKELYEEDQKKFREVFGRGELISPSKVPPPPPPPKDKEVYERDQKKIEELAKRGKLINPFKVPPPPPKDKVPDKVYSIPFCRVPECFCGKEPRECPSIASVREMTHKFLATFGEDAVKRLSCRINWEDEEVPPDSL